MWSLSTIQCMNDLAGTAAKKQKLKPLVLGEVEDVSKLGTLGYRIPFIGSYTPKGWKKIDEWFVDTSGLGSLGEPSLTQSQLKHKIIANLKEGKTYGYAFIEQGQFQGYLGVFQREE